MSDQPASSPSLGHPSTSPVDPHALPTTYSNYFRASGSAEELILDFGFDAQRHGEDAPEPIVLRHRLVLTWGHAQRLARILNDLLQHHDKAHGPNANRPANPQT